MDMKIFAFINPNIFAEKKYIKKKISILISIAATPVTQNSLPNNRINKAAGITKVGPVVIAGSNCFNPLAGD
jgi:hypothetical protein